MQVWTLSYVQVSFLDFILVNSLFVSFLHFSSGVWSTVIQFLRVLYMLRILVLGGICYRYFHLVYCILTLLIIFFWSWEFIVLYLCGQIYVFIGVIIRKPFFTPWLKRNPPIFSFGTCIILFFTFILLFYLEFTLVCGVRYRSTLSFPKIPRLHSLSIIY